MSKKKLNNNDKYKSNKLYRLNVFYKKPKSDIFSYKFFSKSRSFKAQFNSKIFNHINFKGSIMTKCTFANSKFYGVEFWGVNLKKSSFKNSEFKNVIFVAALLEGCNFNKAKFENTIFVNINLNDVKGIDIENTKGIRILNQYPEIQISNQLKEAIEDTRQNKKISKYKILYLSTKKINLLNIKLLLDKFGEEDLIKGLKYSKDNVENYICTLSCLIDFLLKNKEKYANI